MNVILRSLRALHGWTITDMRQMCNDHGFKLNSAAVSFIEFDEDICRKIVESPNTAKAKYVHMMCDLCGITFDELVAANGHGKGLMVDGLSYLVGQVKHPSIMNIDTQLLTDGRVVYCANIGESNALRLWAHSYGKTWVDGESFTKSHDDEQFGQFINVSAGTYGFSSGNVIVKFADVVSEPVNVYPKKMMVSHRSDKPGHIKSVVSNFNRQYQTVSLTGGVENWEYAIEVDK